LCSIKKGGWLLKRESFKSRLGFLLVSAGCAIGIGNVWRFPYVTGQNGGGIFVLFYLIFLVIMGLPVLTMELAVGRASRKSAVLGYKALEKKGSKWHIHGWVAIFGCCMLMMYYTTVSGWMVTYFFKFLTGSFKSGMTTEDTAQAFSNLLGDPKQMAFWMILTVVVGFLVCSRGLQNGLEKISKFMMTALLLLIVVLAVHSLTLSNAAEGIKFYLVPNTEAVAAVGLKNVITAAMNQSFFTLSLGVAAMEIFGSYMGKDHTLAGEGVRICALDTFVAIMAGLIIFPACFSYNVEVNAGPSLIFITLPNVFINMSGGRIWGSLFFLFMTFASFSTVIAVFENIMSFCMDMFGWSRNKAALINCIVILIASLPCVLGYNVWSNLHLIGGRDVLDSEDFIVSNLLLPIGSLIYLLFCVTKWGWGFEKYCEEANTGDGIKISKKLKPYFQFILPILIVFILIQGLI
jgi:neurotransmitter:Na+ symporter, NSS family